MLPIWAFQALSDTHWIDTEYKNTNIKATAVKYNKNRMLSSSDCFNLQLKEEDR